MARKELYGGVHTAPKVQCHGYCSDLSVSVSVLINVNASLQRTHYVTTSPLQMLIHPVNKTVVQLYLYLTAIIFGFS